MQNIASLMKKAQQMKQKMAEMQERILQSEVTGVSGAGLVRVVMSGKTEMKSIALDPSIVNPAEIDVLEDLIKAAVNDARQKVEDKVAAETQKVVSELGLPPGFDLPF